MGDTCQIMITVAGTLTGTLLPFQMLYDGKTEQCHSPITFPEGFNIWHTPYNWANIIVKEAPDLSGISFFHMILQNEETFD